MGLFETNDNTLTGNSIIVGDMIITWDDDKDTQLDPDTRNDAPIDEKNN
jgi:hypothetical protein